MFKSLKSARALVVGGGVVGLFTALELHRAGFQVCLLERGLIGRQASWAGGGILSPLYPWRAPAEVWALARESIARYPDLARELAEATGIDPQWTPSGMMVLDADPQGEARVWARRAGVTVESAAFARPTGEVLPALWLPWVGQIRNPRLCQALRTYLRQQGVVCAEEQGAVEVLAQESVAGLRTVRGERLDADVIVVTAGAWSAGVLAGVSWPLPVYPVKGQMLLLRGQPGLLVRILLDRGRYLIPRRDGRILVGSTLEPDAGFSTDIDLATRSSLRTFAETLLPAGADLELEGHWAGTRPGTDSECPVIARHPVLRNLYVNAGHYRNGLTLAPATASRLVAVVRAGTAT